MKKKILFFVIFSLIFIVYFSYNFYTSKALLSIESVPESMVYINGEQKGKTPIDLELRNSHVLVRLVPENLSEGLDNYETDVKLTPKVKTIVRHVFDTSASLSQTEVISFEKDGISNSSNVAIVTIPNGARVRLDNKEQGVSPVKVSNLLSGRHKVEVSASGYRTRSFDVQAVDGYLLTAFVDLSQDDTQKTDESIVSVLSSHTQEDDSVVEDSKYIQILDTPTGYLRVREKPSVDSEELDTVRPGEIFKVLSFSAEQGWYEIEIPSVDPSAPIESGWITSRYASESAKPQN